mgnify:FL=1
MTTLKQLQEAFRKGEESLQEDEYLGDDSLPYCKKCKAKRWFSTNDGKWAVRVMCDCQTAEAKKRQDEEERRKYLDEFYNRRELSLLGNRYKSANFSTATITANNLEAFEKAKSYVKNLQEVLKNNIGLYVYGDNSTGKTYLTACICNELLWRKQNCIYTNLASMLDYISASYNGRGDGKGGLLARIKACDFAFIDDFGKEFLGREAQPTSSKWAEEKLFEVLNERYNAQKPTIFSSNYSIGELISVLGLDKAIVERVNEMATRVIKLEGDDFRSDVCKRKSEIAKRLGI